MFPDIVRFEAAFGESSRQPAVDQSARHIRFMPIYGKSCELAWWEGSLEESISYPGVSSTTTCQPNSRIRFYYSKNQMFVPIILQTKSTPKLWTQEKNFTEIEPAGPIFKFAATNHTCVQIRIAAISSGT